MTYKIKVEAKRTRQILSKVEKQQYPFALASALTKTAKVAQGDVRDISERRFNIRSKFTLRNIRITPAKKSMVKTGKAFSEVRTDPKISKYMVDHEFGDQRSATESRFLTVPGPDLSKKKFRTATGRVKKRFKPRELLNQKANNASGVNQKKRGRRRRAFIIQGRGKTPMIVRRRSVKTRKPLEILWVLKKNIGIDRRWGFEDTVERSVRFSFNGIFERKLRIALRTAGGR